MPANSAKGIERRHESERFVREANRQQASRGHGDAYTSENAGSGPSRSYSVHGNHFGPFVAGRHVTHVTRGWRNIAISLTIRVEAER
jgi:L-alanine-DL-glutamate epimerase-like enolase superfamily enzyme